MKTLDEVIKALEYCTGFDFVRCQDCPGYLEPECGTQTDALHYLREYKAHQADWSYAVANSEQFAEARDKHIKALAEMKRNDPLSWDELKQMEGKPVWVEINGYNGYWTIVHWNSNIVFEEYYDWIASPEDPMKAPLVSLDDTNFGKTWQAYRKERDEES